MTQFLEFDDALYVVERFGFHLRDAGLFASALARPAATLLGRDAYPTLEQKAAALMESLARNHALFDGNKRTAWSITVLFLWINGFQHDLVTEEAFELIMSVAEGKWEIDEVARVIANHLVSRS